MNAKTFLFTIFFVSFSSYLSAAEASTHNLTANERMLVIKIIEQMENISDENEINLNRMLKKFESFKNRGSRRTSTSSNSSSDGESSSDAASSPESSPELPSQNSGALQVIALALKTTRSPKDVSLEKENVEIHEPMKKPESEQSPSDVELSSSSITDSEENKKSERAATTIKSPLISSEGVSASA